MRQVFEGVEIQSVVRHPSAGGFFGEIIRHCDPIFAGATFGQLSHSQVEAGTIKGWHGHRIQEQWTYVAAGLLQVLLIDNRFQSTTYGHKFEFLAGGQDSLCYRFVPGILHGYRCLEGPAHVIYVTSGVFDLEHDEVRIERDSEPRYIHHWSTIEKGNAQ